MARILEALQQSEAGRRVPVAGASAAPASAVETAVPASEAIPFVEVGGGSLEASMDVLACKVPGVEIKVAPAILPLVAEPVSIPEPEPALRGTTAVSFQALDRSIANEHAFAAELVAFHQPDHPLSQQYRLLLDYLVATARSCDARVLLLSGIASGTGTSTILLNLALTHVRDSKQRVVVVDAALHHPTLPQQLGLNRVPGLHEVLGGLVPLHRAIQVTAPVSLHALALGEAGEQPGLAVHSLGATIQQLRKRFDLVLVDAPTWHGGPDMLAIASACDALFLVMPQHHAETPAIKTLCQTILRQGVRLRGCILAQHG